MQNGGAKTRLRICLLALVVGSSAVVLPVPALATERSMRVDTIDPPAVASVEATGAGGREDDASTRVVDLEPFDMVGLSWQGKEAGPARIRVRTGEGWGPWTELEAEEDDAPDPGSREDRSDGRTVTRPLWVGKADGYELAAPRSGLKAHLVRQGDTRLRLRPEKGAKASHVPAIGDRGAWGARPAKDAPSSAPNVKMAFVHHTAGSNNYGPDEVPRILRADQAFHMDARGWDDIGYNFIVDRFGRIWEGRGGGMDRAVIGAHAGGFNTGSTGVAVIGTFSDTTVPGPAIDAVGRLLGWKLGIHGVDPAGGASMRSGGNDKYPAGSVVNFNAISGHRDGSATDCPGARLYDRLPEIRGIARSLSGHYASTCGGGACRNAIDQHWYALGGEGGVLGPQVTADESPTPDGVGRYRVFRNGSIYWTPSTGAWEVHGGIRGTWAGLGWERSPLGYPITDELPTPDRVGRFNHFQAGSIYWTPSTNAQEVHGAIRVKWAQMGWERSLLGYPVTGEHPTAGAVGRFNHFQGGSIYWTPSTNAQEVHGAIRAKWAQMDWERSALGYPVTGELAAADGVGRFSKFQGGSIYWSPSTNAREVRGAIGAKWAEIGLEQSPLGYPATDELPTPNGLGRFNHFEGGSIYWSPSTNAHLVYGPIRDRWAQMEWENGALGFPTSDVYSTPTGQRGDFQGGSIEWNEEARTTSVTSR
jgi:uncharacterized protein with LGFP repeats